MKSVVFASIREGAGKTSVIVGLMQALKEPVGYVKPLGDRLIYKRKRNRDYDSDLITGLFDLKEEPETITLGFDPSKLRYMYSDEGMETKISEIIQIAGKGKKSVFIEAGKDVFFGSSLKLDPVSLAETTNSKLVFVISGDNQSILDELTFVYQNQGLKNKGNVAIIMNKVKDVDEFELLYQEKISKMGFRLLGMIPFKEQLSNFSIRYVADRLYAKIIAGDKGVSNVVKNIFVGAMSAEEILRNPALNKENKFLITSGDRTDIILAALKADTSGILLTNNLMPPPNVVTLANEKNIPLLLVSMDTFNAARQVGRMETLLTTDNTETIKMLGQMMEKYVKVDEL